MIKHWFNLRNVMYMMQCTLLFLCFKKLFCFAIEKYTHDWVNLGKGSCALLLAHVLTYNRNLSLWRKISRGIFEVQVARNQSHYRIASSLYVLITRKIYNHVWCHGWSRSSHRWRNFTLENLGDLDNASISFNLRISLQHLLNMNRAGRRASQIHNFPPAAWTNVLSRASTIEYDICHTYSTDNEIWLRSHTFVQIALWSWVLDSATVVRPWGRLLLPLPTSCTHKHLTQAAAAGSLGGAAGLAKRPCSTRHLLRPWPQSRDLQGFIS